MIGGCSDEALVGGGEAKVNVGNNMPEIWGRRRTEIRFAAFQAVKPEKGA